MGKFQIFKSEKNNQFYFRLKAGNGEVILASEGYTAKQSCEGGIASIKANASSNGSYERKQNGSSYSFNLKAGNGEIIGRSESYVSSQGRDKGIESVKNNAPSAIVEDIS